MARILTYVQAINEAILQTMEKDASVICFGLGVDDPKGVFGTTVGLQSKFGKERVFDMPASENAMTGVAVGAALNGIRPVMSHQRLDFFLLALDQLVNNAAKWHYMFGGKASVPVTIRLLTGRGWGQGPTHSQQLHSWLAHVPGLKVVMPVTPYDAKGLLISSIEDNNPVVFIEHRWLYDSKSEVPEAMYRIPIGQSKVMKEGCDVTIVASSYMTLEALRATQLLAEQNIKAELIDLRSIRPFDLPAILASVRKTGRLIVCDDGHKTSGFAAEIVASVAEQLGNVMKSLPQRITIPDVPTPTSRALTKDFYPRADDIAIAAGKMFGKIFKKQEIAVTDPHDVPGKWFAGPF